MRISILGSTGSIGSNTLEVIRQQNNLQNNSQNNFPNNFKVISLAAASQITKLCQQALEFNPSIIVVADEEGYNQAAQILGKKSAIKILVGAEGLTAAATADETDCVVNALSGSSGLSSSVAALTSGKKLLLANKESLVAGGSILMEIARKFGSSILPLDSEHNGILRCLPSEYKIGDDICKYGVKQIWLTASGGPFLRASQQKIDNASIKDACNHPTWSMGSKISIDSATMMNKGLEIIEAHHLFSIPVDKIKVVVHPQSIVHCLVEFSDGSFNAQLSSPDMKITIHQALNHPHFTHLQQQALNPATMGQLDFEEPDTKRFPCLNLARQAAQTGKALPAALCSADNEAVEAFLQQRVSFGEIPQMIAKAMNKFAAEDSPQTMDDVSAISRRSAEYTQQLIN